MTSSAYDGEGSILYAIVARGTKILAEYTNSVVKFGNHPRIVLKILEKIPPQDAMMTYSYDAYNFHYEVSDEIVFLCMADVTFSRNVSFNFLKDIKQLWFEKFQDKGKTVKPIYAMNKAFKSTLRTRMNYFNTDPKANKIKALRDQISDVREEMVKNIDKVMERGEKIDILVDRTETLKDTAYIFQKGAKKVKYAVVWKSIMTTVIIVMVLVVIGIVLFFFLCSGVKCISKDNSKSKK